MEYICYKLLRKFSEQTLKSAAALEEVDQLRKKEQNVADHILKKEISEANQEIVVENEQDQKSKIPDETEFKNLLENSELFKVVKAVYQVSNKVPSLNIEKSKETDVNLSSLGPGLKIV